MLRITAASIQVVGGVDKDGHGDPEPGTCHQGLALIADPLASLVAPTGGASQASVKLTKGSLTINPGVYSSIKVSGDATLTLKPGIYIITGGGLYRERQLLASTATARGPLQRRQGLL